MATSRPSSPLPRSKIFMADRLRGGPNFLMKGIIPMYTESSMRPEIIVFASGTKEGGGSGVFEHRVSLTRGMSADEIAKAVNKAEHEWQPKITNMVVHGDIRWDGKSARSLTFPPGYQYIPRA